MTHAQTCSRCSCSPSALRFSVKNAVAQFPPNQRSRLPLPARGVPRETPRSMPRSADNGAFLTLTNENGDTSPGQFQGQNRHCRPRMAVRDRHAQPGRQPNQLVERYVLGADVIPAEAEAAIIGST